MKLLQFFFLIILTTFAFAEKPEVVEYKIPAGDLPDGKVEEKCGELMMALIKKNPGKRYYALVGGTAVTSIKMTEDFRWLYDAKEKALIRVSHIKFGGKSTNHTWSVWKDVEVEDFKKGYPDGDTKGGTGDKKDFAEIYPSAKEVLRWP